MAPETKQPETMNQRGRTLLTLIRESGPKGINRKELNDILRDALDEDDYKQLDQLQADGLITIEPVNIVDHPEVEYQYRAVEAKADSASAH